VICIDSDVFLIDLRYPTDPRAPVTRQFLEEVRRSGLGATTVFNLLELTGTLSFNLSPLQVVEFYIHFPTRYRVRVLPHPDPARLLPGLRIADLLRVMQGKASFGDALIAALINRTRGVRAFVTWNEDHFRGRLAAPVFTPQTYPWPLPGS